jgi:esterase/lipase
LIYFHGNAEDLAGSVYMMNRLSRALKCHIIGLEYPGYGICFREKKNSNEIVERAKRLYEFLTVEFGYQEKDIILFGRSLGSGPAVQLASHANPSLLILMSAYSSIKNVAKDICR